MSSKKTFLGLLIRVLLYIGTVVIEYYTISQYISSMELVLEEFKLLDVLVVGSCISLCVVLMCNLSMYIRDYWRIHKRKKNRREY